MNENKFEHDQEMSPEETRAGIKILLEMKDPNLRELFPSETELLQNFLNGTAEISEAIRTLKKLEDTL